MTTANLKATSIRLDNDKLERLDNIAKAINRPRTWVINEAIAHYLDYEEWFVQKIQQGLQEADTGELIEHDEIVKKWTAKREAALDTQRKS